MTDHDQRLMFALELLHSRKKSSESASPEEIFAQFPDLRKELEALWATAQLADFLAEEATMAPSSLYSPQATPRSQLPNLRNYELLEEIGHGGMGVVFRARQHSPDRIVAVKMLLQGELASPEQFLRFQTETAAVAQLDHPNIITIHEAGIEGGQPFYSMPLVQGTTLARRIAERSLTDQEAAELLIPVCQAVAAAHRQGVLHRDLKPSNILIDQTGRPFVSDFGLAKILNRPTLPGGGMSTMTLSGQVVGTPGYLAPEQATGSRGQVGPQTDVYSLGAILYACVTGRAPFQAASPIDAVLLVLEQDPPAPRLLQPLIAPDLEMIILKALQKPVELRYASAEELAHDLQAFLRHEPVQARSSQLSQILTRAFRPTHHVGVLKNWGLLWIWHALVLLVLCGVTDILRNLNVTSRFPYVILWTIGLGTWGVIFWNLRRRSGPVTFVERQVAHLWAASMACSTSLFAVEWLLQLPVLTLSPVLALFAGAVFLSKAGILSGEFYIHAVALFLTAIPMALFPSVAVTIFGIVSALAFGISGLKFHLMSRSSPR
jgi:serine/threonine-protein kinase